VHQKCRSFTCWENADREERSFFFSRLGKGRKGPFSCFINLGETGFVPSYILCCHCHAAAREQQERLASAAPH